MKKLLFVFILVTSCFVARAQMARWIMQPNYDRISIAAGAPLLIADSLDMKSIWSIDGKHLSVTRDILHPFCEGLSVTTEKDSDKITGFYDMQGKFTSLSGVSVVYNYPYFNNGYLLVRTGDKFSLIDKKGGKRDVDYIAMYPFNYGLASYFTYEQLDKFKNPYYGYATLDNRQISYSFGKNKFVDTDIEFLSSINDEGVGLAIIKQKMYFFDAEKCSLQPIFAKADETNIKRQVSAVGDINTYLVRNGDNFVINGKGGKADYIKFELDELLRLTKITFADREQIYQEKKSEPIKFQSSFSPSAVTGKKYGLMYEETEVLPAQFDEVGLCLNDFAVVRMKNKWGMLTYDESLKYRLIMHSGKNIAFRHKDVATTIKLELPPIISADKCRFDVEEKSGCVIDKISLETKNTENGNYVQYNCVLSIPDSLPDVVTDIQYPVSINYDGLIHPTVPIKTKAWHYKYINVDLDDTETTVEQGNVSFTINIAVDKQLGDNDYPFEVEIRTDSLRTELIKISETRYKCRMFMLAEGINNVNINILEDGCPPSIFPFEVTYIKPVEKTRTQPEVKEGVKIEKKVKAKPKIDNIKKEEEEDENLLEV